jgi:tmRNA-binding protein
MAAGKEKPNFKVVADNRRARYDYEIGETFEAGLMLTGPEVKSLRTGKATVAESYAGVDRNGEVMLYNANIPEYLRPIGSTTSPSARANCCYTRKRSPSWPRASNARA